MNVQLQINGEALALGIPQDRGALVAAGIKKMGFLSRGLAPVQKMPGDVIFFAKNPRISVFGDKVQAVAILDTSMGADMMNGTSCYAIFNANRLRYVICQVIQNRMAARLFVTDIRSAAREVLGEPTSAGEPNVWQRGGETFVSEIGSSGSAAFIHWWG